MAEGEMTSIEVRLNELETLTQKLESGQVSIDEAIALYSKGMQLAVSCKKSLDELSMKIEVAKQNADKAINLEPLENNNPSFEDGY